MKLWLNLGWVAILYFICAGASGAAFVFNIVIKRTIGEMPGDFLLPAASQALAQVSGNVFWLIVMPSMFIGSAAVLLLIGDYVAEKSDSVRKKKSPPESE